MRVLSVAELGKCFNGCKWVCGRAVVVGVKSAFELTLALKQIVGGEAYVVWNDVHVISKKCYIVLATWWVDGGIGVREALGWESKNQAPWEP